MSEREDFQIHLNEEISMVNQNNNRQLNSSKVVENAFAILTPNKNSPLEMEKDMFDITEEDLLKPKSQLRRELYYNLKKKIFHYTKYEDFVIKAFNLTTVPSCRQKEWILKQMKRRKTNKKNTFDRKFKEDP